MSGWIVAAACALLAPDRAAAAPDRVDEALEYLVGRLDGNTYAIQEALERYSRIEVAGEFDIFGRHRLHQGLLRALRDLESDGLADAAERILRRSERHYFPAKVLLLKAVIARKFPAARERRLGWLAGAARGRDERLSIWGVRLLADSGWPEAIDELIAILREEEAAGRLDGLIWSVVQAELFRVLGAAAARGGAGDIAEAWEKMGKKPPADPDYRPPAATGPTIGFFGDRISPRSVFVIDTSTSMLQETTLREGSSGKTVVKGRKEGGEKSGKRERKVDIVKAELVRALNRIHAACKFNIISYNAVHRPWRARGDRIELQDATPASLKSAIEFSSGLEVDPGTNIHDSLAAALAVPEVETIYLLSDGSPSRGGGPPEIERRVEAMNYLLGARIITYGFTPEGGGTFDEPFMKRLAKDSWGWYRRLN